MATSHPDLRPHPAANARQLIASLGWLAEIDPIIANRILDMAVWRTVPEGTVVYQAGAGSGDLFGVASGQVVIWHGGGSTDAQFVHMFRVGQWFGWAPILAGDRRRHQSITRSVCHFAILPETRLRAFLADDPEHWHALASLVDMQAQISELAGLDLLRRRQDKRLAATLLRFAGCRLQNSPDGPPWPIAMTQLELAEAANISRNAASRLLVKMEAEGLLRLHYRHIDVLSPDGLRDMLDD
jgi:CRP/FNR family transcriptional regulator, cyclic AMP receptor protein